jgi:hypothetical protein
LAPAPATAVLAVAALPVAFTEDFFDGIGQIYSFYATCFFEYQSFFHDPPQAMAPLLILFNNLPQRKNPVDFVSSGL